MMSKTVIPHGYKPLLDLYQTQTAIGCLKRNFEQKLCAALNLKRVSAPLFVEPSTGLNDDLNGVERPVSFDLKETGRTAQVVHSLAKWKRMALYKYGFTAGEGLYTDMNAIRRDEEMDNLHSVYVDQWDWEKVITPAERTTAYLQSTVRAILRRRFRHAGRAEGAVSAAYAYAARRGRVHHHTGIGGPLSALPPKARENAYLKTHKAVFLMQIGGRLRSGERHDGRAPDYDDWTLNGDLLFWNDVLRLRVRGVLYGHPRGPSGAGRAAHRSGLRRPPDADVPQAAACG